MILGRLAEMLSVEDSSEGGVGHSGMFGGRIFLRVGRAMVPRAGRE